MLQLINGNARVSPGGSAEQPLAPGFAQAGSAEDAARPFDLQLAVQGFAAADTQALQEPSVAPETRHVSEADAEQWLASVLGQQAVRIEARDVPEPAAQQQVLEAPAEPVEPLVMLPSAPFERTQMPSAQPQLPADTSRVANAAVSGLSEPVAASRLLMAAEVAVTSASPVVSEDGVEVSLLERLLASSADADKATPSGAGHAPTAPAAQGPERALKLHAPQAQWGEQMLHSLREQVELQINQRIQNATIRLDPPELGSLEIFLSHESGRLSVQLSAANADVARLLQQTSERLRQELVGQHFVQVNVQVSADAQGGRQQQQAQARAWLAEDEVVAAVSLPAAGSPVATASASDVLVTV
ncbi:MAG: flagellar hook-length control protein FliK [Ectopseudomonas guguanensis]|uniref:flagellar hook-length control protein FliK n=1 Tax=Ectopseudomonas guguanensis TaxID=1198456 RepID=UPI003919127A